MRNEHLWCLFRKFLFISMETLTLQIDDHSVLDSLKRILKLIKGVRIVSTSNNPQGPVPNDCTLSAMKEAETGKDGGVVDTTDLNSFIASME